MTMLEIEIDQNRKDTVYRLKNERLVERTEAYIIEHVTQKVADLFLARHGEQILADLILDPDIKKIIKNKIVTQLHEASERILRRAEDNASLRGEGSSDQKEPSESTG